MSESSHTDYHLPHLPEGLRSAYTGGDLVLFVGAGVSQAYPSCLPGFWKLADEIASGTGQEVDSPLDQFLGRLSKGGVDVHREAKEILDSGVSPSQIHKEVLKIFGEPDAVRIVTTNFDRLLTKAAGEVYDLDHPRGHINHYLAPALPYGDDFSGIVHLHGSLDQSPRRLVLTDRDFGEAYVNRGWARDFLVDLFSNYTVLFIGYSHEDTIVKYLSRSIPAEEKEPRFALVKRTGEISTPCFREDTSSFDTQEEDDQEPGSNAQDEHENDETVDNKDSRQADKAKRARWEFLGVKPIFFPHASGDDSFVLLPETLSSWKQQLQRTGRDFRQLVSEIVEDVEDSLAQDSDGTLSIDSLLGGPDVRILKRGLQSTVGARTFWDEAKSVKWLSWLEQKDILQLGETRGDTSEPQKYLRTWVTEKLAKGKFSEDLLLHLLQKPKDIQRWAANCILQTFAHSEAPNENDLRSRWLLWLMEHSDGDQGSRLYPELLKNAARRGKWEEAVLLLDEVLSPIGVPDRNHFPGPRSIVSIKLSGATGPLRRIWESEISPSLSFVAGPLATILERHLTKIRDIAQVTGASWETHRDRYSEVREDVAESREEDLPSPIHLIVDMAVYVLGWHIENREEEAQDLINHWANSHSPLLKRIAIYGVEDLDSMTEDEKLDWILNRGWVLEPGLRQESGRMIQKSFASASDSYKDQILDSIADQLPSQETDSWEGFSAGSLLKAISEAAPTYEPAQTAWAEFRDSHPDIELAESENKPPTIASRGHQKIDLIESPPSEVVEDIIDAYKTDPQPTRGQFRRRVEATLRNKENWTKEIAEKLAVRGQWDLYLWHPLLKAIEHQTRDDPAWFFEFINEHSEIYSTGRAVTRVLKSFSKPHVKETLLAKYREVIEKVASQLLSALRHDAEKQSNSISEEVFEDLIATYRNIWLYDQKDPNQGEGLNQTHADRFLELLSGVPPISQAATRVLVAELNRLHYVDPDWTREHVLQKFEWTDPEETRAAWRAFLSIRRPSAIILREMKPIFRKAFGYLEEESEEDSTLFSERFIERMAIGALYAFNPLDDEWIIEFHNAVGEELQTHWAKEIRVQLSRLDREYIGEVWENWLETYWKWRTRNKPVQLSEGEHRALFGMVFHLADAFPKGVEYLLEREPISLDGTGHLRSMQRLAPLSRHPDSAHKLLQHVIEGWDGADRKLGRIAKKMMRGLIAASEEPKRLRSMVDALADQGAIGDKEIDELHARIQALVQTER